MSGSDEDFDVLAAEYALGLLDEQGAARVAELRAVDQKFDAAVRAWERRLMPLAVELPAVEPPAAVWAGIAAAVAPAPRPRLWDNLRFWRFFGLGAAALAAATLVFVILPRAPVAPAAVASLRLSSGGEFVATAQRAGGGGMVLVVSPADVMVPAQRSAELWLILPGQAPLALGVLASAAPVVVKMPGADIADVTLAVSLEPPGGAPDGKPTGPVVGSAKFSLL